MIEPLPANVFHYVLEVDGFPSRFEVVKFRGEEAISQPFHFEIGVESDDPEINPSDICGASVVFKFNSQGHWRSVHGVITRFEVVGQRRNRAYYVLGMSPELALLGQQNQSRIFQKQDVVSILRAVLLNAGMASDRFRIHCSEKYPVIEYCVQYGETNLNFFQRLTEHFGIFYYFDFAEEGTSLIIGDSTDSYGSSPAPGSLSYLPPEGLLAHQDTVSSFQVGHTTRPTKHIETDYNFEKPHIDLTRQTAVKTSVEYGWQNYPGKVTSPEEAEFVSRVRQELEECLRDYGEGTSDSIRLIPGTVFDLEGHFVTQVNQSFLVTSVVHDGTQTTSDNAAYGPIGYSNHFRVQSATKPFRPALAARKPRVEGSQTAVVTGPSGEEICSDKYGRIKVRFHWDLSGTHDEQSSCWIRVAQSMSGNGWGAMVIPRIGQEVLVDFLEGDPDRPVVTGCLYNAANMPPYELPAKQTVAVFRSNSTPGGQGQNEIRLEDSKGSEEFYLHAQKDLLISTLNDKNQSTGNNETLNIGKNRTKSVGADEQVTVTGNRTESVDKDESITIGKNRTLSVGENRTTSIGKDDTIDIGKNLTVSVTDNTDTSIGKSYKVQIGKDHLVTIDKAYSCSVRDSIVLASDKDITLKCGAASIVLKKNGDILLKGKNIAVKGSGNVTVKGSKIAEN